jgi:hypothetical protein
MNASLRRPWAAFAAALAIGSGNCRVAKRTESDRSVISGLSGDAGLTRRNTDSVSSSAPAKAPTGSVMTPIAPPRPRLAQEANSEALRWVS